TCAPFTTSETLALASGLRDPSTTECLAVIQPVPSAMPIRPVPMIPIRAIALFIPFGGVKMQVAADHTALAFPRKCPSNYCIPPIRIHLVLFTGGNNARSICPAATQFGPESTSSGHYRPRQFRQP